MFLLSWWSLRPLIESFAQTIFFVLVFYWCFLGMWVLLQSFWALHCGWGGWVSFLNPKMFVRSPFKGYLLKFLFFYSCLFKFKYLFFDWPWRFSCKLYFPFVLLLVCIIPVSVSEIIPFSFLSSELSMSYSHDSDDEYEKLIRRMNPPRYQHNLKFFSYR